MNRYRCSECGCYLDPGEGRLCEECLELKEKPGFAEEAEPGRLPGDGKRTDKDEIKRSLRTCTIKE